MSALTYDRVGKTYRNRWTGETHVAVDDVSFTVEPGERIGLVGESGAGKSTLARMAAGLVVPDRGRVRLFDADTSRWSGRAWHAARRRVQLLFQDPRAMLHPAMRVRAIVEESAKLHRPEADPRREAASILDAVGLLARIDALPHELSGGEQRRVGLARVLLARPRLLIADEPTAGLDAERKAQLIELMLDRAGPECAVILVSHDLPVVAWACHRLLVAHAGRIVDDFAATALPAPRAPYTEALLRAAGLRSRVGQNA